MRSTERSAESSERGHDGTVDSIWLRPEPERATRGMPLTRERIVAQAVALLNESGTEGLTMRRLAQRLNVTPTALYWHVRTKDDILDLAVDQVFADVLLPEPSENWQDDVRLLTHRWREVMLRHPWAAGLIGRPMLGPNVLARTEFLQSALVRGGLTGVRLAVSTRMIANFVIGAALTEATWRQVSPDRTRNQAREHIAARPATYPTLVASGHLDSSQWDEDDLFTRGITELLSRVDHQVRPE
ncbi:TetR/AcrR family transcriptional regulator C-terminal domain-containing protein [Micromonospora sp. WMMD998]|uniref:TetR/AcrR family transcriptional regulator C-terminal domain-containing protein n=1 Tax=Micromonospora sp. WMMD998 TaxID=3016092 RepID=UPI0032B61FF7